MRYAIHKEVVVATVRTPEFQETREFKTFTSSLTEIGEWLKSLKVTHVAMESTGVYWKPPKAHCELRDLTCYRRKLIQAVSADKNRMVRVLEDGNIKLSSVLSSTSGVTAEKFITMLCSGWKITMNEVMSVYHKRIQAILETCTATDSRVHYTKHCDNL